MAKMRLAAGLSRPTLWMLQHPLGGGIYSEAKRWAMSLVLAIPQWWLYRFFPIVIFESRTFCDPGTSHAWSAGGWKAPAGVMRLS